MVARFSYFQTFSILYDEPEAADDEEDIADDDQFVQTVRWESRSDITPPAGEVVVTYQPTNDGPVYRAAVWDGSKFYEPGKPKKVLIGLKYTRWIRLPRECSQAVALGEEAWHRGTEPPQNPCWVVARLSLNGRSLTRKVLYYSRGDYYFNSDYGRHADIEPVTWIELPELPDWAEVKGDTEDYE